MNQSDLGIFICLDFQCGEAQRVIKCVSGMFLHKDHNDLKALREIREDFQKNSVIITNFLCYHDKNIQMKNIEQYKQVFYKETHIDMNEFLERIKNTVIKNHNETQRLVDIINAIQNDDLLKLDQINGDFTILKDIRMLEKVQKKMDQIYIQGILDIKELMKKINSQFAKKKQDSTPGETPGISKGPTYETEELLYIKIQGEDRNGQGSKVFKNGNKYSGNFKDGKMDGYGKFFYNNGDHYQGEWVNDMKHGEGEQEFSNGEVFKGNCVNGKMDGPGEYSFENGESYQGQFQNDMKNGLGVFSFSNGNKYQGNYKDSEKDGYGEFQWANGNAYKGQWKNDLRHGQGCTSYADGRQDRYDNWIHGQRQIQ